MNDKANENKSKKKLGWEKKLRIYFFDLGKRAKDQAYKDDWTDIWVEHKFGPSLGSVHQFLEDMVFLTLGGVILSIILVLYFYFMLYKDELFNLTVTMMVDEALRYGTGFPQVYASFGAAIIICIYMFATSLLLILRWSPKKDLTRGLADIAYAVENLTEVTNATLPADPCGETIEVPAGEPASSSA